LRRAATKRRGELRRLNREISTQLSKDITTSDAKIKREYEMKVTRDFDAGKLALAIAATDAQL
jgi:hypothetical protein